MTAAAARKGVALERSGSMAQLRAVIGPGSTVQEVPSGLAVAVTPASRSMCSVMSMCGVDGTFSPVWRTVRPSAKRAPASSSPETNWE